MIKLVVKDSEGGEAQFPVTDEMIIGRNADCTIVLSDHEASREHARIYHDGTGVFIEDLASTNGTLVNGDYLDKKRELNSGDRITIGSTIMRVLSTNPLTDFAGTTRVGITTDDVLSKSPPLHRPLDAVSPYERQRVGRVSVKIEKRDPLMWLYIVAGCGIAAAVVYYCLFLS